jgi:hypothetical protein
MWDHVGDAGSSRRCLIIQESRKMLAIEEDAGSSRKMLDH